MSKQLSLHVPLALICLVLPFSRGRIARAQEMPQSPTRYIHSAWTTENGLPQNDARMIQTRDGYLWLGTFGGLARFDEVKFTIFDTGNTPALKSNQILSLFEQRRRLEHAGWDHPNYCRPAFLADVVVRLLCDLRHRRRRVSFIQTAHPTTTASAPSAGGVF